MVTPGDFLNPRQFASDQRIPGTDGRPYCCVYSYTDTGDIVGAECVELTAEYDDVWCTTGIPIGDTGAISARGVVSECCRECELLSRKLIITRCSNRTFIAGTGRILPYTSPAESPEDCCCGDVPRCVQVPGCNQVDCYPEPPDTGNQCDGRCLSMQYDEDGNEIVDERGLLCATKMQCCADDNSQCEERCYDSTIVAPVLGEDPITPEPSWFGPENQWTPMACTTGCGVCCTHVYDTNPESPTYRQSVFRLGVNVLTEEECALTVYDPNTLGPVLDPVELGPTGDWVANTDDINVCNPNCCLERLRGQAEEAVCHYTSQLFCDPCVGRCIDVAAELDPGMCPREFCATKQECCGAGNEKCLDGGCGPGSPAPYRWEPLPCGTDGDRCGTCCKHIYNENETEIIAIECAPTITTKQQCEQLIEGEIGLVRFGTWTAFETCATCNDSMPCCREISCPVDCTPAEIAAGDCEYPHPQRTVCVDVAVADCNPCHGRCTNLETGEQNCKTRADCCGPDGSLCENTYTDALGCVSVGPEPTFSWEQMGCTDPVLCGICCVNVYDVAGGIITKTCNDTIPYAECVQPVVFEDPNIGSKPYGTWVPFKTCADHDCLEPPRKWCCMPACDPDSDDVECRYVVETIPCNECNGRCAELDADGLETGVATCKEKWDCCGQFNELCTPDCGLPAKYRWTQCGTAQCGICCLPEGVAPPDPMSAAACAEAGGVWHPYAQDNSVCGEYQCCVTVTTSADRTKVFCAPSDTPCQNCIGVCTELDDDDCLNQSCVSYVQCCGAGGKNCPPFPDATHSYATYNPCVAYNCPGCCCKNTMPTESNIPSLSPLECELCYAQNYTYQCSFTVTDCAACPPCDGSDPTCVSNCTTDGTTITCFLSGTVTNINNSPCLSAPNVTYTVGALSGKCGVWQAGCSHLFAQNLCVTRNSTEIVRAVFTGTAPNGQEIYEETFLNYETMGGTAFRWFNNVQPCNTSVPASARYNPSCVFKSGRIESYEWKNGSWSTASQKLGDDLVDYTTNGFGVLDYAVSGNGKVLILTAARRYSGSGSTIRDPRYRVYDLIGGKWRFRGFFPQRLYEAYGTISINYDGTVVAKRYGTGGSPQSCDQYGGFPNAVGGCVFVYDWDGVAWQQRNGKAASPMPYFGFCFSCPPQWSLSDLIDISDDGNTLIVIAGAHFQGNDINGAVSILKWDGAAWTGIGTDERGTVWGNWNDGVAGARLSGDASRFVVYSGSDRDGCANCGKLIVYGFNANTGTWVQVGNKINLRTTPGLTIPLFYSTKPPVVINTNGTVLAAALFDEINGTMQPVMRAWEFSSGSWVRRGSDFIMTPIYSAPHPSAPGYFNIDINAAGNVIMLGYAEQLPGALWGNAAVPLPRAAVLDYSGNAWVQRGSSFNARRETIPSYLLAAGDLGAVAGFSMHGVYVSGDGNIATIVSGSLWTSPAVVDVRPDCTTWRLGAWYVEATVGLTGNFPGWGTIFSGVDLPPGNIDARAWANQPPWGLQRQFRYKDIGGCDPDYVGPIEAIWYDKSEAFGQPPGSIVAIPFQINADISFIPKAVSSADEVSDSENPFP